MMEAFTLDLNPQPAARRTRFLQRMVILLLGMVNVWLRCGSAGVLAT